MAGKVESRVKETTTTTGTGDITLAGAATGFRTFNAAFGTGTDNPFFYVIELGSEYEEGEGHLSAASTLVRDTVFRSSNSDGLVNFSVGTKNVFCDLPGHRQSDLDAMVPFFANAPLYNVRDQRTSGTTHADITTDGWHARTLQTEPVNQIAGASLASNQVTLPAGDYFIYAVTMGYALFDTQLSWYNVTDSADEIVGVNGYSAVDASAHPPVLGHFSISAEKSFELRQFVDNAAATTAEFGFPVSGSSTVEVYADVYIWKLDGGVGAAWPGEEVLLYEALSSVDPETITPPDSDLYDKIQVEISELVTGTDARGINVTVNNDTAASAYRWVRHFVNETGHDKTQNTGDTHIEIIGGALSSVAAEASKTTITFSNMRSGLHTQVEFDTALHQSTDEALWYRGVGYHQGSTAKLSTIELDATTGNFSGVLKVTGWRKNPAVGQASGVLHMVDEKLDTTVGGAATTNAWTKHDCAVSRKNTITGASSASSVHTLPAGTYEAEAEAVFFKTNLSKIRLFDTTNSNLLEESMNIDADATNEGFVTARVVTEFTLTANTNIELQYLAQTNTSTSDLGPPVDATFTPDTSEIYAYVKFKKVA